MRKKLVVIGNGMAATRVLEELLALAPDLYHITVFGAEPQSAYNRILLTPLLAGELEVNDILLHDRAWYTGQGITLHTGSPVTHIDRARRTVTTEQGLCVPYDRLLMATGSRATVLPVPGHDLDGVFTYRDVYDAERLMALAQTARRAVVIGGGLLGLEAASGLARRGLTVTVLHQSPWILNRQLDETAATLLQKELEQRGIRFCLSARTQAILGENGRVRAVQLADGSTLPSDCVVMALGIRPEYSLAEAAGLPCDGGILVNDVLQTFDPRIYAVGECVKHRGVSYGLVEPLYEQARVCANHLAERGHVRYGGSRIATKLKVSGIQLFSAGNLAESPHTEELLLQDEAQGIYKRLLIEDDRLRGVVMYGDTSHSAWYFQLLQQDTALASLRDSLMFGPDAVPDLLSGVAP